MAPTTCRRKSGKLNLNNPTMINANREEIRKALEAKGAEFRASLDKTMEVMDKYQDAIENESNKAKFKKVQDEYIRNISKLAPQNERLSLEFSKIAGLALYYELPVDEKNAEPCIKLRESPP